MKKKTNDKPQVNPELEGLDIQINPFGELKSNISLERINEFLNKNVPDKKLQGQGKPKK